MIGKSMMPLMRGQSETIYGPDEPVGYELAGSAALFKGDFKLVKNISPLGDGKWHLHDLKADPGEVHDLANLQPERLKTMLRDYDAYAKTNGVLPVPNDFDLQQAGLRYALWHFLIPKIKTALLWALLFSLLFYGGFRQLRRTRLSAIPLQPTTGVDQ